MSDELVWEEPPEKNARGRAARILEELSARPGQWARVAGPEPLQRVESLRVSLVRLGCQGRRKTIGDDSYLWARYIGKGDGS